MMWLVGAVALRQCEASVLGVAGLLILHCENSASDEKLSGREHTAHNEDREP